MVAATRPDREMSLPEGAGELRRQRLAAARLYFVCEGRLGEGDVEPLLRGALGGGAQIVQLRDRSLADGQLERAAQTFRRLAEGHGALFIVNDRPDLAKRFGADGVHLGQEDADPAKARELLGPNAIIGLSTHSPDQIAGAHDAGVADYISVGPVWETPTKPGRPAVGLELVRHAAQHATLPFFAIGGIDPSNIGTVIEAGARRAVVVRAIRDAKDPRSVAAELRRGLDAAA